MAALSASKNRYSKKGNIVAFPMVASDIIYRGSFVMINSSGYAAPAATGAGSRGAGFAMDEVDNSSGSAGDLSVRVEVQDHHYIDGMSGLTQADIGKTVYASTDNDFSLTQGNDVPVGVIVEVLSATECVVKPEFGGLSV